MQQHGGRDGVVVVEPNGVRNGILGLRRGKNLREAVVAREICLIWE